MSNLENRLRVKKATGGRYPIDIVFVVDATESMNDWLETVKFNVLRLGDDLQDRMTREGKVLDSLRVRLIVYRDLLDDLETAFELTPFFELPGQKIEFQLAVKEMEAFGGDDVPESGLDALFLAMRSPWRKEPRDLKRRHIIILFTDADSHDIGETEIPTKFAQKPHPKSFTELKFLWNSPDGKGLMNEPGKRLILFAPDVSDNRGAGIGKVIDSDSNSSTCWSKVYDEWSNCWIVSDLSEGLSATEWETVLSKLTSTL